MKKLTGSQIRRMFLDYFKSKNHQEYPSQSLIPVDDPTLLWINSGVATLKKYFDGRLIPENRRITSSQKSIRTNDIENVGKTARHHTFFEMLGNFSVGDYFKKEAIQFAWELLTSKEWFGFDKEKLYATIYQDDDEAFNLWVEVGMDPTHIVRLEDNFWEIGEGPSGPNTEIFYDRGPEFNYDTPEEELYPGGENERYLEIWNLVFSQFNAKEGLKRSEYPELPSKNIDTGMGLERMASVIQGVETNYDTDLFLPIINEVERISGKKYRENEELDVSFRVIADHIRACIFAINDGALPSNEGRGYVIRRLIRRAVKYALKLDIKEPFMKYLVPVVAKIMEDYYPEITTNTSYIQTILEKEEARFHETLDEGLTILSNVMNSSQEKVIDGKTAFKLYDTFGFPIELTIEYAEEKGFTVDVEGFKELLEAQRKRAREAREEVQSMQSQNKTLMDITLPSEFVGYEVLETESKLLAIVQGDKLLNEATKGMHVQLIFDKTPFYATSGGQVADKGVITNEKACLEVEDVSTAPNKQNLHHCFVKEGKISVGDTFTLKVDKLARILTERNHTATHLLHKALKTVLGNHVSQAGSEVSSDRLRFDITHFAPVTKDELQEIERIVNEKIASGLKVTYKYMSLDEAKKYGAVALFTEKYGNVVRVVSCEDFSKELCGGCHVKNTAEIGLFKIVSESGIGAGIRRIEAVTSLKAIDYLNEYVDKVDTIAQLLKGTASEVVQKVQTLVTEHKQLEKELESLHNKLANIEANELLNKTQVVNGYNVLSAVVKNIEINALRNMVDNFKDKLKSAIVVLADITDDKVIFMAGVTPDYVAKGVHAGNLVKELAQICGGGGGGRPDFAQAGAKNIQNTDKALNYVTEYLKNK
ncbi:MAG: alanine--tRNA ligase [Bacilli bacterium]|nr:alanine--tRNA ligase [Bacilli bacterium]